MDNKQYKILSWKNHTEKYEKYWNEVEDSWLVQSVKSGEYAKIENHFVKTGLFEDFKNCISFLEKKNKGLLGFGAEIASGSTWLTAHILNEYRSDEINKIYAIDFSRSYIFDIAPRLLTHYNVPEEKVDLCYGSFYDIKLADSTLDFVVMSQAFHHAHDPDRLLQEISRVLNDDGFVIMVGEIYIQKKIFLKCFIHYVISTLLLKIKIPSFVERRWAWIRKIRSKDFNKPFQEMYFPADPSLGDQYHLEGQYESFFLRNNFYYQKVKAHQGNHLSYILTKKKL